MSMGDGVERATEGVGALSEVKLLLGELKVPPNEGAEALGIDGELTESWLREDDLAREGWKDAAPETGVAPLAEPEASDPIWGRGLVMEGGCTRAVGERMPDGEELVIPNEGRARSH